MSQRLATRTGRATPPPQQAADVRRRFPHGNPPQHCPAQGHGSSNGRCWCQLPCPVAAEHQRVPGPSISSSGTLGDNMLALACYPAPPIPNATSSLPSCSVSLERRFLTKASSGPESKMDQSVCLSRRQNRCFHHLALGKPGHTT